MHNLIIQSATTLDAGILCQQRGFIGISLWVDATLHGHWDKAASPFLVDFAVAKRYIKHMIDVHFDHKLWLRNQDFHPSLDPMFGMAACKLKEGLCAVYTKNSNMLLLDDTVHSQICVNQWSGLEQVLALSLKQQCPYSNIEKISVQLRARNPQPNAFGYTHAICVHQGKCQRIHGHSGLIEVWHKGQKQEEISTKIATLLDQKLFLKQPCVLPLPERDPAWTKIIQSYPWLKKIDEKKSVVCCCTGTVGPTYVIVPQEHLVLLPLESSAETLVDWAQTYLTHHHIPFDQVVLYEGLCNGLSYTHST